MRKNKAFLKIILILVLPTSIFLRGAHSAWAQAEPTTAIASAIPKTDSVRPDERFEKLTVFLDGQKSPLVPYASEMIKAADTFGLDWRLVPAITGVESSFGKRIPYRSFNAYGWNNGDWRFESWEDSIWHVSKILRTRYVDRGATNVWSIGRIYAASPTWASRVNHLMAKIEATPNFILDL